MYVTARSVACRTLGRLPFRLPSMAMCAHTATGRIPEMVNPAAPHRDVHRQQDLQRCHATINTNKILDSFSLIQKLTKIWFGV